MAFMGVRMSWVILERNVLLALLAACACSARTVISFAFCWAASCNFLRVRKRFTIMIIVTAIHEINTVMATAVTGCRRIISASVRFVAL